MTALIFLVLVVVAVVLLKGFDNIAGRGPKQISDGIAKRDEGRIACPHCAEAILPAARICPHCRLEVRPR